MFYRFRANTVRRLKGELADDERLSLQGIEEAQVMMQRHLANADFWRNKAAFLTANLDCTRRRVAEISTPTADGE